MPETTHSPGPWDWYGPTRGEGLTFTHEAHVGPGEGNDICGPIAAVSGDDSEQAVANARLISAAPDLLSACRSLVERFELADLGDEPEDGEYGDGKRALTAGLAAIAKATGQA